MWPRGRRDYYKSHENIHQPSEDTWQNATVEENRMGHSMVRENELFSRNNLVNYNVSRDRGQRLNAPLFANTNPSDDSDNESIASSNGGIQSRQRFRRGGYPRRNAPNTSQRVNQPVPYQAENMSSRHNFPQAVRRSNNWRRGRGRSNRGSGYPNQSNWTQSSQNNSSGQQRASQAECALPSNAASLSNRDKITLMTDFKNILQTINPSDLIKEYRQRINKMQENCLGKHEKRFRKITSANEIANNKEGPILKKHLDIIKQQLRTFEHCISNIKAELSDMYMLQQTVVYRSCEEKLEEAKNECKIFKKALPVYAYKREILSSVARNQVTIVSVDACYSSGEMIPLFLHQAYRDDIVLACEPNNATAISLAQNCKILESSSANNSIAYKTDNGDETTKDSKIIFISALKLYQEGMKDPHLSDYKIIVLQCDLKRSIETDFLIECLRNCLKETANLKLILILPPLCDSSKFVSYFSSVTMETLKTPNIIFPVRTVWKNSPFSFDVDCVHEVVDTALGIHALHEKGDVLIFLPTYSDAERASKMLSSKLIQYSYRDASCILMHEDTFDQSNFNFPEPDGNNSSKRRFFLTTSWAEVFPLPSVVYVIDTGIQKCLQYNQQKAADFLKETFISRERAKLRKHCAGRYSTGICFRLYSKHDYLHKMPLCETSEVLCKNPLEIMVKLFQYCPERAMNVEFVENMSNEVKAKTSVMLKNANAMKDGKLTTLGEQIVKLPFLPKYSKLIVIGIQWGFSFEVIVLVAFFVVNKPVFTHSTDDKEIRRNEEATKLQYISFDSDTLTNLNIYRKWMLNDCLESWCIERALSFSVLTEVQAKVKDIIIVVGRNLKEDVCSFIKSEKEMDCLALREILFDCFKENLCVYTGHHRSGYHFLEAECITFLHPSSSILQKGNLPEFVVFDHLDVGSRHFMMGVTAIPKSIIMSFVKRGSVKFDEADLSKRKLEPVTLENFGVTLIKHVLLGRKGRKLMEIEDEIKKETKCDLIVIEPSEEKGTVTVFAPPTCTKKAEMMIRQVLESKFESVFNEEDTLVLDLKRGQSTVPINITWKKGAVITKLKPELQGARPAVKRNKGQLDDDESSTKQCINLTWIRRLCKGFGFLTFADKDFMVARRLAMTTLTVNDVEADIQLNKNFDNQLYITGLPSNATDEDLKMAFNSILEKQFLGNVQVEKANVIVQKPFETTDEQLHHLQDQIYNDVYKLLSTNNFTVSVPKPKYAAMIMEAYISFSSPSGLEQIAILLGESLKMNDFPVKSVPVYSASVIYNISVFNALKEKMEWDLRQLDNRLRREADFSDITELFKLNVDSYDNGLACLKLSTNKEQIINSLQRLVNKWLEGEIITCKNFRKLHKLFTHGGHLWLKAMAVQEGVHIIDEYKSKSLRLYGTKRKYLVAIDRIKEYLHNTKNEIVKEINLSNGKHVRTLLKAVISKYGVDLKNFMQEFHLRSASINIRNSQLIFHGDSDNVEQAVSALEDLASSCSPDVQDEFVSSQEICCMCIMPPLQSSIRLEHCGHLYCAECLKGLIMNAKFPILCGAENCEKELILEDIRRGLDDDDDEINRLLNLSMNDFIIKNREDFIYCPAPDCSMIFEKKEISGTKWRCRLCQNDICIQCNVVFHHGYTCKMYQGTKDDPNYSVKMWLKDTKAICKPCPKCNTGIEKNLGCDHMTCNMCHAHFCWLCLKLFPNGVGIYGHIPYCRENRNRPL